MAKDLSGMMRTLTTFLVGALYLGRQAESFLSTPSTQKKHASPFFLNQQQQLPTGLYVPQSKVCGSTAFHPIRVPTPGSVALFSSSSSSSKQDQDDENPGSSLFRVNPLALGVWSALLVFGFGTAPGSLNDPQDAAMLAAIIANPTHPDGINTLYYYLFNVIGLFPLTLAAILLPQGQPNKGLPAGPFVALSAALGFFALGPFMVWRAPPRQTVDSISWITANVFENKILAWILLAFYVVITPLGGGLIADYQQDPAALWSGFVDLVTTSRFAAVSCADLTILHCTASVLILRDYQLRTNSSADEMGSPPPLPAWAVALAAAIVPVVGPALYCALRPPLPLNQQE